MEQLSRLFGTSRHITDQCYTVAGTNVSTNGKQRNRRSENYIFCLFWFGPIGCQHGVSERLAQLLHDDLKMLEGIINTKPTSQLVLSLSLKLASIPGLTLLRPSGACTRVNPGIDACVDKRPHTNFKFGFVYVCEL